ncbi:Required for meiotic nuclear division protein 1 [Cichlidogyrus casuarinus]|uniref:Required for meiotic nuclear division protein 1 n=1 Tax=Cichlidogyrus casuarinus TaxID=1844966 RepID=A0ABD2QAN5_9PLAT
MPADVEPCAMVVTEGKTTEPHDRLIFIYRNGSLVFWNFSPQECRKTIDIIKPACREFLLASLCESEELRYAYTDSKTHLKNDDLYVHFEEGNSPNEVKLEELVMDKYALSDALALSVKLNLLENAFDAMAAQMEPWISVSDL